MATYNPASSQISVLEVTDLVDEVPLAADPPWNTALTPTPWPSETHTSMGTGLGITVPEHSSTSGSYSQSPLSSLQSGSTVPHITSTFKWHDAPHTTCSCGISPRYYSPVNSSLSGVLGDGAVYLISPPFVDMCLACMQPGIIKEHLPPHLPTMSDYPPSLCMVDPYLPPQLWFYSPFLTTWTPQAPQHWTTSLQPLPPPTPWGKPLTLPPGDLPISSSLPTPLPSQWMMELPPAPLNHQPTRHHHVHLLPLASPSTLPPIPRAHHISSPFTYEPSLRLIDVATQRSASEFPLSRFHPAMPVASTSALEPRPRLSENWRIHQVSASAEVSSRSGRQSSNAASGTPDQRSYQHRRRKRPEHTCTICELHLPTEVALRAHYQWHTSMGDSLSLDTGPIASTSNPGIITYPISAIRGTKRPRSPPRTPPRQRRRMRRDTSEALDNIDVNTPRKRRRTTKGNNDTVFSQAGSSQQTSAMEFPTAGIQLPPWKFDKDAMYRPFQL